MQNSFVFALNCFTRRSFFWVNFFSACFRLTLHRATPVSKRSMKFSTLIFNSGYNVLSHSARSSRIAYKYSSLDLNGRYDRASNRTVFAILTISSQCTFLLQLIFLARIFVLLTRSLFSLFLLFSNATKTKLLHHWIDKIDGKHPPAMNQKEENK